ncbi:hypothetical protein GIB67_025840 [Kingdonia uniflora]|uniref:WEB family protein n=1 Tax=Kingdonia uniflora TaxID=39325 RepID=A0A7J7NYD9_9MAGN|nr:hypothetical protein GIB67_025840 [Kingdonia uniflora]
METQYSTVDTSRPFKSVKEAVETFGERFLAPNIYTPKPFTMPKYEPPPPPPTPLTQKQEVVSLDMLKKLELELEETKRELKMLKEREKEMEIALASLNMELQRNMSKVVEAGKKVRMDRSTSSSTSLAQLLNLGEKNGYYGTILKKQRKLRAMKNKKKPIVPLVGDMFPKKKKGSSNSTTLHNSLRALSLRYFC